MVGNYIFCFESSPPWHISLTLFPEHILSVFLALSVLCMYSDLLFGVYSAIFPQFSLAYFLALFLTFYFAVVI